MLTGGVVDQGAMIGVPGTMGLAQMGSSDIAAETLAYAMDLRNDFSERDRICNMVNDVIYMRQRVNIPINFRQTALEVQSPLAMHISNQITAALSINTPRITFDPIEFGGAGEDKAAYRARFFMASWNRQQREKQRAIYQSFMHSVVTKGTGVLKTFERKNRVWAKYRDYAKTELATLDKKYARGEIDRESVSRILHASTEQYKRGLPYPIETTDIPVETFYYQQSEDGLSRVVEIKEVPFYDTLRRFGVAFDPRGRCCWDDITGLALPSSEWHKFYDNSLGRRTIQMIEMWDVDYCTIVLRGPGDFPSEGTRSQGTGLVVKRYKHTYGDKNLRVLNGPYFPAAGITTSNRRPHETGLSVLFPYLHLFPMLNALLTMQGQAAFTFSYPAYRRTQPPAFDLPDTVFSRDAVDQSANRERVVPGAILPYDIAAMDQPRTSIDLDKAIRNIRELIDLVLPDSVRGVISGETAGYALSQAAHLASLSWDPIKTNTEACLSRRVSWESELIDSHIGETVYVWGSIPLARTSPGAPRSYKNGWMGIGPKELQGVHNYNVIMEPASINNDTLKLRVIRDKLDMRLIDPYSAIRELGGNPEEVERAWLLYELKQDDEIRRNMKQRTFQALGTMEQESLRALPAEGAPGGTAPAPISGAPAGAQPGVSQGLPATGFVPPAGAVAAAPPPVAPGAPVAPPAVPAPMSLPRPPGTPAGAPGGVRGAPASHSDIPGGG